MIVDALDRTGSSPHQPTYFPDVSSRLIYATGILAAVSIPPLQFMSKSCGLDQLERPPNWKDPFPRYDR
jgi:hypothetical protein